MLQKPVSFAIQVAKETKHGAITLKYHHFIFMPTRPLMLCVS